MTRACLVTIIGKLIRKATRFFGKGHGSALPGLVVEKLYPDYLARILNNLPYGVMVVSGTNGKTTTTKIITELMRSYGLKVFTNPSGSNFTRGVVSAALSEIKQGKLDADIAVIELDEAHAVHFVNTVRPRYSVLLNVLRDQLDRFGEIDKTAQLLQKVAEKTDKAVIMNYDDPRINKFKNSTKAKVAWFGVGEKLRKKYKTDEELHSETAKYPLLNKAKDKSQITQLVDLKDNCATYKVGGRNYKVELQLFGQHNALNSAAAIAAVKTVMSSDFNCDKTIKALSGIKPAFGRGEIIEQDGREVRLILVKNPSGFQLSLGSSSLANSLIAINDNYADGRDVSWLYDVNFSSLAKSNVVAVSGVRASDMALRLVYAGLKVDDINCDLDLSLKNFLSKTSGQDVQIFATYTAMLKLRSLLK